MSDNCGCTCQPDYDQTSALVKAFLYEMLQSGDLQPPLLGTNGNRLGQAVIMTASETREYVDKAINSLEGEISGLSDKLKSQANTLSDLGSKALTGVTTNDSLAGSGTTQSPLQIAASWLTQKIGSILSMNGATQAAVVTTTDSVATTIIGDTSKTMGGPSGFIPHPTQPGYGIPVYSVKG